jgi:hypothetical protein
MRVCHLSMIPAKAATTTGFGLPRLHMTLNLENLKAKCTCAEGLSEPVSYCIEGDASEIVLKGADQGLWHGLKGNGADAGGGSQSKRK